MINTTISLLLEKQDLSKTQVMEVFDEILSGLVDESLASSFLTAIQSKGFCEDEILGAILASSDSLNRNVTLPNELIGIQNLCINSSNKYIDISLMQDIICSANDLYTYKYSFLNSNKVDNSFKILELMGVKIKPEINLLQTFEGLNFAYYYLSSETKFSKYAQNIRRNLPFYNLLDIASKFLNPLNCRNFFFGVNDKDLVNQYAGLFLKLGFDNSIVLNGDNDFPFISLENESCVAEAWKNKIFTYVLSCDLLGFKKAPKTELECENNEQNAQILLDILNNKITDSRLDAVVLNSALSLYIAKKANSIMNGVEIAKKTIESGLALEKFEQIKKFYLD